MRSGAIGGAGTQASPFGTIAAALAQAGATATIALSQGSYTEAFALPGGITLRGACSTGVLVGAGAPDAVVTVAAGANALVDLAVMASGFGISISPGASAALRGVLVDGSRTASAAIVVHGALVAVDSAFLRAAVGVEVLSGGHAELDGVVVADNSEIGLSVDRASASLHRVAISLNGRTGILATDSALHASESIFDANMHAAIEIAGAQASATFARSLIQGTRPGPGAGDTPAAVYVWDRARVLFDRVLFDSNASMGLRVISGGALDLENVVVSDVAAVPSFGCGIGVAMTDGVLVARKLAVRRFHENALFLQGNTVADIEDISISSNVDPCIAPTGFVAADTASVAMRRAEFTAVRGRAIRFENPGAVTPGLRGHLSDIRVTGMSPMDDGVLLASSSSVTVERARFEGVGAFAVRISGSAHVTVKDVEVVSSQNHGFFISESAVATVIRARLASIGAAGAYGPQPSRADFTAITVDGAKNGFEANAGSVFTVRDFAVRHGAIGVLLDDPASSITLENGRIEDNQTGASFPAGFDTSALMRRVVFSNMQEFVAR